MAIQELNKVEIEVVSGGAGLLGLDLGGLLGNLNVGGLLGNLLGGLNLNGLVDTVLGAVTGVLNSVLTATGVGGILGSLKLNLGLNVLGKSIGLNIQ